MSLAKPASFHMHGLIKLPIITHCFAIDGTISLPIAHVNISPVSSSFLFEVCAGVVPLPYHSPTFTGSMPPPPPKKIPSCLSDQIGRSFLQFWMALYGYPSSKWDNSNHLEPPKIPQLPSSSSQIALSWSLPHPMRCCRDPVVTWFPEELALRWVRRDLPPAAEVETLRYVHPAALGASFAQRPVRKSRCCWWIFVWKAHGGWKEDATGWRKVV